MKPSLLMVHVCTATKRPKTKSDTKVTRRARQSYVTALVLVVFLLLQLVDGQEQQKEEAWCCNVVAFAAEELADDGTWTFAASMSSLYEIETGWDQYCNYFEVRTLPMNGNNYTVLGTRELSHPHPNEQPFTRRVRNVVLPDGVDTILAVAHDTVNGFCGAELALTLSGSEPTSVTAPPNTPPPVQMFPPSSQPSDTPSDSSNCHTSTIGVHVITVIVIYIVAICM